MKTFSFPANPDRFCVVDVGSTTTKAVLFLRDGTWRFHRAETPTTVEKPYEDVSVGLLAALRMIESATGIALVADGRPAVPLLACSSAGGGLAMVVTGLVREFTARSADIAALGAGAIVLDIIAMDDGRTPYRKIEDLKALRPDMVLLAGGFDADNITGPVFLAELVCEAGLKPKLSPKAPLPLLYAGNARAVEEVRRVAGDRVLFRVVPNIRPDEATENFGPARDAIHELFMDHVMSHAPGYDKLLEWVDAPVMPTPAAFSKILDVVSADLGRRVLAVDIGGATTDVFSAQPGRVFRSVSANLGLSYSALNVCAIAGPGAISALLGFEMSPVEVWNRVAAKYVRPTRLPDNDVDMQLEWALAAVAIREAVRAHAALLRGAEQPQPAYPDIADRLRERVRRAGPPPPVDPGPYDLLIGSGGILSHSPRAAAARVLVDALLPADNVEIALDNEFVLPLLGILAETRPGLARELFRQLALVNAGKAGGKGFAYVTGYVPPAGPPGAEPGPALRAGPIQLKRELAIPGTVLVKVGQTVTTDTVIARSTRQFLRPFFLPAADAIGVPAEELPKYLKKSVGDAVDYGDTVAFRHKGFANDVRYRSPVRGRIERLLPGGVLLVRESPEEATEYTAVDVARELDIERYEVERFLRVKKGDEVERGQWVAATLSASNFKFAASPVRGRVNRIDSGMVVIEPLLEELAVKAWLPGKVASISERGAVVTGEGTVLTGTWGSGGERSGIIDFSAPGPGRVFVTPFADAAAIAEAEKTGAAGVIAAGVNVIEVLDPEPGFTIIVTEGFGRREFARDVAAALAGAAGRVCLLDGRTRLRVGVLRPFVVIPD